jgi:hypothetical protein
MKFQVKIYVSILLVFLIKNSKIFSQSITPFTVNIAGFTTTQNGYSLTVSTGETISITNFKSPNGESLNSGFLQNNPPLVTGIGELLSKISVGEVTISPNPVNTETNLITNFVVPGQMQYQILDITSKLLYRSQPVSGINNKQTKIDMTDYTAGTYYILVFFKPIYGISKTGIFKIVKL